MKKQKKKEEHDHVCEQSYEFSLEHVFPKSKSKPMRLFTFSLVFPHLLSPDSVQKNGIDSYNAPGKTLCRMAFSAAANDEGAI